MFIDPIHATSDDFSAGDGCAEAAGSLHAALLIGWAWAVTSIERSARATGTGQLATTRAMWGAASRSSACPFDTAFDSGRSRAISSDKRAARAAISGVLARSGTRWSAAGLGDAALDVGSTGTVAWNGES
jgi:hypothetical protein